MAFFSGRDFVVDTNQLWTRQFEGSAQQGISFLLMLFPIFAIFNNLTDTTTSYYGRFLGYVVCLIFLLYPRSNRKKQQENYLPWYDVVGGILGLSAFFFFAIYQGSFVGNDFMAFGWSEEVIVALIGILMLAEACRRVVGWPILVVAGMLFLNTVFLGRPTTRLLYDLFFTDQGVVGSAVKVCATYIVLFCIFGSFLESIGVNDYFIACAEVLAGGTAGGSAKVEVLSSALCGMVSGSSAENALSTGKTTIPLMRKNGFSPSFSAAVTAASSAGGQIMPPIMGSAAFLMGELYDIPYKSILLATMLPAFLYFLGIFFMIHFKGKKMGLGGVEGEDMPSSEELWNKIYLLLPIVVFVVLIVMGCPVVETVIFATFLCVLLGIRDPDCPMDFPRFCRAMERGTKTCLPVAVACGMAGVISGIVTSTGLGRFLVSAVVSMAGNDLLTVLFLTMVGCLILGMALPPIANYAIMAAICAPILIQGMGVEPILANMFVFYFGIISDVSPPVSVASYTAAQIAKASSWETAWKASVLAIGAFIIPYMFVYHPALLLLHTDFWTVIFLVFSATAGMFAIAIGVVGFFLHPLSLLLRIFSVMAGGLLVIPETYSDVCGMLIIALIIYQQTIEDKKKDAIQ